MEEESNAEPEKEQPNQNTSVEEEEEYFDEEEEYDEDEEADYEEDFSEEEDELEEGEVIVWSKEQEEVLKSALASFTLLPQTTVRKGVEELEGVGGEDGGGGRGQDGGHQGEAGGGRPRHRHTREGQQEGQVPVISLNYTFFGFAFVDFIGQHGIILIPRG